MPFVDSERGVFISEEQLAKAPEAVRDWLEAHKWVPAGMILERDGVRSSSDGLAICDEAEVRRLLDLLRDDYLSCQVLFALGCDYFDPATGERRPWRLHFDDFHRHTDIRDSGELNRCFTAINGAIRRLRDRQGVELISLEEHAAAHVHADTQHAIYQVWRDCAAAASGAKAPSDQPRLAPRAA